MFTKDKSTTNNRISDIRKYFECTDITNSGFFKSLPRLRSYNKVLVKYKRYDLLAEEVYGDPKYSWILQMYTGINENDLDPDSYIDYPSMDSIKDLIINLDNEYKNQDRRTK